MEEEKLGGYTKNEWKRMISDKVVGEVSDEIKNFIKPNSKMKKVEETEVKEIEIFTTEQLEILPEDTKNCIINLDANLPKKELMVLNPLMVELFKIKELEKLIYTPLPENPTKDEIEQHKENVEKFKSAKKSISEFKSKSAAAKKDIKGPLDLLGSQVITVERSVNKIAEDVLAAIEKTFKVYIEAEKAKAAAALAKRQEKATQAVNALTEQNTVQSNMIKKGALITFLKYEMLEPIKTDVNIAVEKFALEEIYKLRDGLKLRTFETYSKGQQLDLLTEDELTAIKTHFENENKAITLSLDNRIVALEALKTNEKLTDTIDSIVNPITPVFTAPNTMAGISIGEVVNSSSMVGTGTQNNIPVPFEAAKEGFTFKEIAVSKLDKLITELSVLAEDFKINAMPTPEAIEDLKRVKGGIILLNKTKLYILNQLPPAAPKTN